jgi:putative nucleotidyltransferase with HDIG domain
MTDLREQWQNLLDWLKAHPVGDTTLFDLIVKLTLFTALIIIIPLLFSSDNSYQAADLKIGAIASQKVVAPFNFFILKTKAELDAERAEAIERAPFYFRYSDSITNQMIRVCDDLAPFIIKHANRLTGGTDFADEEIAAIRRDMEIRFGMVVSDVNLRIILSMNQDQEALSNLKLVTGLLKSYIRQGILSLRLSEISRPKAVVMRNGVEENLPPDERRDVETFLKIIENRLLENFDLNTTLAANYLFAQFIKPNLLYDRAYTEKELESAIAGISHTRDMVFENERIVDANERIDEIIFQKLYSLEMARMEHNRREGNWANRLLFFGRMIIVAVILLIPLFYLISFRRDIFKNNHILLLITIIILLLMLVSAVLTGPLDWRVYLIPTTIASMLLAILIDSGIALLITVVIALLLGGIHGSGYEIVLLTLVSGSAAIYSVRRIRHRNQVFKAILFISLAYLLVVVGMSGLRLTSITEALRIFIYNLLPNAVLSPFITFMVLGVFERLFDITTDVTLLELSDLNHILLKKLAMEAPGTFHHSMVVGNLSESAAKAIGANSLLARVGSYYHDIGKMEKPEYFFENQMDADNRHNALTPNMSALILASHVKGGVELAKKYHIPKSIRDFIPQHHGTNIMAYFYDKALKSAGSSGVIEADFRYPGPKPQSREAGVVMLADASEAAVKSLPNPTPHKIRQLVENLVDKRFRDGELDECDLTLRDLKKIVDAFMSVLFGMFKRRIEYPDLDKTISKNRTKPKSDKSMKNGNSNSSVAG